MEVLVVLVKFEMLKNFKSLMLTKENHLKSNKIYR